MSPSRRTGNTSGKWRRMRLRGARGAVAHGRTTGHGDGVARRGVREGCGMPSRAPRRGAAARWGHSALPQRDRTTGHEGCARRWDRTTEHAGGARGAVAHDEGCERGAKVLRRQFCGGVSYSRRLRDGFPSPSNPKSFSYFRNTLWQIELF